MIAFRAQPRVAGAVGVRMRVILVTVLLVLLVLLAGAAPAAAADRVQETIDAMEASGRVDAATADRWSADWADALSASRGLAGAERVHMRGVVANTQSFARRGALAARAPLAMLTVQRNVEYFWRSRRRAVALNTRTTFAGSPLVFQLYAASGWQLQPLGNLGTINALSKRRRIPARARAWADELLALAVRRDGMIAFEHMFPFAGGAPGWVSTMPQAVAVEAYTRLGMAEEARQMLAVLQAPPPSGVRLDLGAEGDHLLQYSQAPTMLVGNSFAQALLSLHAYVGLASADAAGRAVYERALLQARVALARYDTGSWSLYFHRPAGAEGQESDLHYHRLFGTFLGQLCERIGGEPFCSMQANFARYETEPVLVAALVLRASRRYVDATTTLSKRGAVSATMYVDGRAVRTLRILGLRGPTRVRFPRPVRGGVVRVDLTATSLTGLPTTVGATRVLAAVTKKRRRAVRARR
jgi:hypothetical protein